MKITTHRTDSKPPQSVSAVPRPGGDPIDQLRRVCIARGIEYDGRECLKQEQVALLLGISKRSLQRLIEEGRLTESFRLNSRPRYALADLAAFWEPPLVK
jgi:hypothetical protein